MREPRQPPATRGFGGPQRRGLREFLRRHREARWVKPERVNQDRELRRDER